MTIFTAAVPTGPGTGERVMLDSATAVERLTNLLASDTFTTR